MTLAVNINRLAREHLELDADQKPMRMPALFHELDAAVTPGNSGTKGGKAGAPIPINPTAIDLMVSIKRQAHADHYEMRGWRFGGTVTDLLLSYTIPVYSVMPDAEWESYLEHVTLDWCDRIDALVRPRKPRRKLGVPCPRCNQQFHGEERELCLTVNCWGDDEQMLPQGSWDARCESCGTEWRGYDAMTWFLASIGQGGIAA